MTNVVILIPGIMGSEFRFNGQVIWPGPASSMVLEYKHMTDLLRPDVEVSGILRSFGIISIYQPLIDDLEVCGFEEKSSPPTLYLFPYDWRKSNYDAAKALAARIDKIREDHKGDLNVTIVAHSMGGLVARCYLECGDFNGNAGFGCVRMLIAIATPHRGAPVAALFSAGLRKQLFLSATQVHQLANDSRYPAVYELLPPAGEPFAWPYDEAEKLVSLNIYDNATAAAIGFSAANLTAAQAFHQRLDLARRPAHVRYFAFYGARLKTTASISLRRDGAALRVAGLAPDHVGDGTVPVWSSLPGVQSMPAGQEHMKLFWDADVRRVLAVLLGAPGTLAGPMRVQVVANQRVVETDSPLHVSVIFPAAVKSIAGELRWLRLDTGPDGKPIEAQPFGDRISIRYTGGSAEKIGLLLTSPPYPGFYRIEFTDTGGLPSDPEEIVVQQPPQ